MTDAASGDFMESSYFNVLLRRLAAEHEREVEFFKSEVKLLQTFATENEHELNFFQSEVRRLRLKAGEDTDFEDLSECDATSPDSGQSLDDALLKKATEPQAQVPQSFRSAERLPGCEPRSNTPAFGISTGSEKRERPPSRRVAAPMRELDSRSTSQWEPVATPEPYAWKSLASNGEPVVTREPGNRKIPVEPIACQQSLSGCTNFQPMSDQAAETTEARSAEPIATTRNLEDIRGQSCPPFCYRVAVPVRRLLSPPRTARSASPNGSRWVLLSSTPNHGGETATATNVVAVPLTPHGESPTPAMRLREFYASVGSTPIPIAPASQAMSEIEAHSRSFTGMRAGLQSSGPSSLRAEASVGSSASVDPGSGCKRLATATSSVSTSTGSAELGTGCSAPPPADLSMTARLTSQRRSGFASVNRKNFASPCNGPLGSVHVAIEGRDTSSLDKATLRWIMSSSEPQVEKAESCNQSSGETSAVSLCSATLRP